LRRTAWFAAVCLSLAISPAAVRSAATQSQPATRSQTAPQTLDVERLRIYHLGIVDAVKQLPPTTSFADLVRPVMRLAHARTGAANGAEETRAALIALALYANGWHPEMVVPEARDWPRAESRGLLLRGRSDLTQHFALSAVIAAAAGTPIADAAGLYKELSDARRGSGFSFSDLAADRAGATFGLAAAKSNDSARRLLDRIKGGLTEDDFMPAITGLPDNLPEAEFTRRFGGIGGAGYNSLAAEIDKRVAALALFQ